jgi:hypothetical protein
MAFTRMPTPDPSSNHKKNYGARRGRASDIAGYRYGSESVCSGCIKDLFAPFYLAGDADVSTEEILDANAKRWHIDRAADRFSSYDFPHRIHTQDVIAGDVCYVCGKPL